MPVDAWIQVRYTNVINYVTPRKGGELCGRNQTKEN